MQKEHEDGEKTIKAAGQNERVVMCDYYYSPTQENVMIDNAPRYIPPRKYVHKTFKGRPFTVVTDHGEDHGCNFDDMVLVGSGYDSDVEYT